MHVTSFSTKKNACYNLTSWELRRVCTLPLQQKRIYPSEGFWRPNSTELVLKIRISTAWQNLKFFVYNLTHLYCVCAKIHNHILSHIAYRKKRQKCISKMGQSFLWPDFFWYSLQITKDSNDFFTCAYENRIIVLRFNYYFETWND